MINIFRKTSVEDTSTNCTTSPAETAISATPKTNSSSNSLIGRNFGDYVVVSDTDRDGSGHKLLLCVCPKCGDSFKTTSYELLKGRKNTVCKKCEAIRLAATSTSASTSSITCSPNYPSYDENYVPDVEGFVGCDGDDEAEVAITVWDEDELDWSESDYITHVIPLANGYSEEEYEVCCGEKVFVRDLEKDLLEMPVYYHIAHCIPADITFYGATARRINEIYDMGEKLTNDGRDSSIGYSTGEAILIDNVFNLIATEKKHKRPIMDDLYECVFEMASTCAACGIKYLAMPRLGCGHNKLNWEDVEEMIISTFVDVYSEFNDSQPIYITFCHQ